MTKGATSEGGVLSERDERLAYFDRRRPLHAVPGDKGSRRGQVPGQDGGQAHRALAVLQAGAGGAGGARARCAGDPGSARRRRDRGSQLRRRGGEHRHDHDPCPSYPRLRVRRGDRAGAGERSGPAAQRHPQRPRGSDHRARGRSLQRGRRVGAGRRSLARWKALDRNRPQQAEAQEPRRERDPGGRDRDPRPARRVRGDRRGSHRDALDGRGGARGTHPRGRTLAAREGRAARARVEPGHPRSRRRPRQDRARRRARATRTSPACTATPIPRGPASRSRASTGCPHTRSSSWTDRRC